jgi:DNA uptake protein ComE-like DNA-binding protein
MSFPRSSYLAIIILALPLAGLTACTTKDNPDEIRQRTAEATETVRRDAKAVAEGVKEGMGRDKKAVNINRASREDLLNLPGISEHEADRIIAERPYDNTEDLVRRHVLPREEYEKISDRIIAGLNLGFRPLPQLSLR